MTLFEQCSIDAGIALGGACTPEDADAITRAVLNCVLENTSSPRTVDEMERILGEAPASAPYVA